VIATLTDTLGWALAIALCVPGLGGRASRALGVLATIAVAISVPVAGVSLIAALRGLFAGLSLVTVVVLAALFIARTGWGPLFRDGERRVLAALAALTGVLFYPAVLGLTAVDPYFWGYGAPALPVLVGGLGVLAWMTGFRVVALALVVALVGWRVHLLASPNLWDYLIDPLFALGALLALPVCAISSAKRARRRPSAARSVAKSSPAR
jgi:hypothetical protein